MPFDTKQLLANADIRLPDLREGNFPMRAPWTDARYVCLCILKRTYMELRRVKKAQGLLGLKIPRNLKSIHDRWLYALLTSVCTRSAVVKAAF